MPDLFTRLAILVLLTLLLVVIVRAGQSFVARQRRMAFAAPALEQLPGEGVSPLETQKTRILAFSSAGCTQCHTLQQPALRRLQEARGEAIDVVEVDAPASPELVKLYRVMTVPSTVVLNAAGEVHAVNYGFAPFSKLNKQIDDVSKL